MELKLSLRSRLRSNENGGCLFDTHVGYGLNVFLYLNVCLIIIFNVCDIDFSFKIVKFVYGKSTNLNNYSCFLRFSQKDCCCKVCVCMCGLCVWVNVNISVVMDTELSSFCA